MSTLKVSKVEPVTTGGDCIVKATNIVGNKNLVINGAMQVAQRGTSSTSSGFYTLDRFQFLFSGHNEALTQAQHALTSSDTGPWAKGFRNSYHITNGNQTGGADAADYAIIRHNVEAQDIANSGWDYTSSSSYITLSFWVKSSVAQNFYGNIITSDGTAQNYPYETGSLSANTWTKIIKTIPGNSNITVDNNNGSGFQIDIWPFGGTTYTASPTLNTWAAYASGTRMPNNTSTWWTTNDSTFEITGVQLEVGDVATGYEHKSYHDDLMRCFRYFYKADGYNSHAMISRSSTAIGATVNTPVPMRASPTAGAGNWCRVMKSTTTDDYGDSSTGSFAVGGSTPSVTVTGSMVFLQYGSMSNVTNTGNTGYGYLTNPIEFEAEL